MTEKELKTCACVEDNCNCKEIAESELRRKLDLLLRTGSILMESAADTSRIMRTMKRAAAFLGLDERYMHLYINWNVLMVNYSDEEHSFSKFQRCEKHGINLTSISQVSKLTWKAIKDNYSLEQYEQALNDIKATPRSFTPWQVAIGGGFACGGFCIQFGCDWPAFFFCSLAAILGFRLRMFLPTKGCNNYVAIGISASHSDSLVDLIPFAQPIDCRSGSSLHAFRYPMASADGVCPLHRAGSSTHQLCVRYARRIY